MMTVAVVAAVIAALVHLWAWVMESFLFHLPQVQRIMLRREEPSPGVRLWAFSQGFYNLFFAVGMLIGVAAWASDNATVGRTLIVFCCGAVALAGAVLFVSDRRLWLGALGQSIPPAVAALAALAA